MNQLRSGIKAGTVIALGYIPIAIAFGLLAKAAGIAWWIPCLMSLIVFAGASQFVGINMIALGAASWEIVMTTFILNLRHFLMSTALSQRIRGGTSKGLLALIAFGVTDETFSVASLRKEGKLTASFLLGLNFIAYSAWNAGTWLGMALGSTLPASVQSSMGISLYAMFIGLLIPTLRQSHPALTVACLSIAASSFLSWVPGLRELSAGWIIMIATLIASTAGALLFPAQESDKEEKLA